MNFTMNYKNAYAKLMEKSLGDRREENQRIREKYSERIPVMVDANNLPKCKWLVPNDLTVGQFAYILRKRMKLNPEDTLFMYFDRHVQSSSSLMSTLDNNGQGNNEDGFLHCRAVAGKRPREIDTCMMCTLFCLSGSCWYCCC